ncbi:GldG family protein [Intestinicryptomonas porci]|uniref:GldG family protein n=1 Tax=Intestinicryptomonas porci TaxID=2926320 RepID=A0ABU4WFP0_9BACT|nr:GldG family protein [Opitutales bacterium CLA-KB-P66]
MRRSKKFENFRVVGTFRAINLFLQIFLAATLFIGLNLIASRHYIKYDFSKNRANSLSPESVAYLKTLKKPVEIYLTMRVDSNSGHAANAESKAILKEITRLLELYAYSSSVGGERKVKFAAVDPIVNRKRGDELALRFGRDIENCIIISCEDKNKKLVLSDLYDIEDGKRKNFKGEQAVSSAILSVSSDKENKIYFVKGHGELSYKSLKPNTGLSEFANALSLSGYKLDEVDLNVSKKIPEDADMLVIAAPQTSFLPRELDLVRKYLSKNNGRVVMFLGMGPIIGLDDILFEWGLRSDDMMIVDSAEYESSTGEIIARVFPSKPHPVVKYLVDLGLPVQFGSARPVREDLGAAVDGNLSLFPLIGSNHTSWADKSYKRGGKLVYDDAADLKGPLPLAMIATRKGGSDLGLDIGGGRLAVFGDENFITNARFNALGNSKLAMNTINWLFDENHSLNIAPRKVDRYSLVISRGELKSLGLKFLILPAAILLAGFLTYLLRRQ